MVRVVSHFREEFKISKVAFPIHKNRVYKLAYMDLTYATFFDLNMGYFKVHWKPQGKKLCTIVFPWGDYSDLRLAMGVPSSPDIVQSKISHLMVGLDSATAYLKNKLVATKGSYNEHLQNLEQVLLKLEY